MSSEARKDSDEAGKSELGYTAPGNGSPMIIRKISTVLDDDKQPNFHNFKGDQKAIWRFTALVSGAAVRNYDDIKDQTVKAKWWFCHRVEIVNAKTGEINEPIRTVFVSADNIAVGFVSDFIAHELDTMRTVWGDGPWEPELEFTVGEVRTRKGFRVYTIIPV